MLMMLHCCFFLLQVCFKKNSFMDDNQILVMVWFETFIQLCQKKIQTKPMNSYLKFENKFLNNDFYYPVYGNVIPK